MTRDRWTWFAAGVVLGLVLGASVTAGYFWTQLLRERELALRSQAEAVSAREEASDVTETVHRAWKEANEERDLALKELEALKKARDR